MKNTLWAKFIGFLSSVKTFFSNRKYSATDIIAMLALILSLYQFYFQKVKQEKEEYEKKFLTIRESSKFSKLSDLLTIKELLKELDNKQRYGSMTDVQKETLALGYKVIRNDKRSFEISKENIETNLNNKSFDAAGIYFDNFSVAAMNLGEVKSLENVFTQLDRYYTVSKNRNQKDYLNARYSMMMMEYSIRNRDSQGTLKFMERFYNNFDSEMFENIYRQLLDVMSPEIRKSPSFVKIHNQLLEKYRLSEIANNSFAETYLKGLEKMFLNLDSTFNKK